MLNYIQEILNPEALIRTVVSKRLIMVLSLLVEDLGIITYHKTTDNMDREAGGAE